MLGRETASGIIEKSAVLAPCRIRRFRLSSAKVLAGPSGWTAKAMGTVQISATGPNSRHGSYVRPLRDLPAHGTSILIQATRRVAGSPRAPRFTCHKMGCEAIGMPRRPSARAPQRVKQSRKTIHHLRPVIVRNMEEHVFLIRRSNRLKPGGCRSLVRAADRLEHREAG
jgi:hypothetical protein